MNYYKHHLGDFIKKTLGLTATERGVYLLMMHMYYISESALPLDLSVIYRSIGVESKPEKRAVEKILSAFFEKTESGFINSRCEEEIQLHRDKSSKASQNGQKGGRGNKRTQSEEKADALDSLERNRSIPSSHKPIANSHIEKETAREDEPISEPSEYKRLLTLWESIRRRDPERDPAMLVSDFERGHLSSLYFGHGFERVYKAIDTIGQLGWYATIDQIKEYLATGIVKPQRGKRPAVSNVTDRSYYDQEGAPM